MTLFPTPSDAFSHSQIKSKFWLADMVQSWQSRNLLPQKFYLHWLASWVGIGPFVLLSRLPQTTFSGLSLYDLNENSLKTSHLILDYWRCQNIPIELHCSEINNSTTYHPQQGVYINTSCEHMRSQDWLNQITQSSYVVLQSTDMAHPQHFLRSKDLNHFKEQYSPWLEIRDACEIDFSYPDKKFARFMLLGIKK